MDKQDRIRIGIGFLVLMACIGVGVLVYFLSRKTPPPNPPPNPPPKPPKSTGNYTCNSSGLCVLDEDNGTMSYEDCVKSCQGKRSPDPMVAKPVQNCKNAQGATAGSGQATFEGCKNFNPECCFNPNMKDAEGHTAWCYQPAEGETCSTFSATNCSGCGLDCGNPNACAQKTDCCFDYNAIDSTTGNTPAWCYEKGANQQTCRDRYPKRVAPETYYSFKRVIDQGGVVPPANSQMDAVPGSVLDDGITPIYQHPNGKYLVDWDCSSGMLCGNSWGKPSDQAKVFVNLLALDSDNSVIQNNEHRVAYIKSQFYDKSAPPDGNAWQLTMLLNGPGIKNGTGGCLGRGESENKCKALNVWEGNKMMYSTGFMVFPGYLFNVTETLYGHYGSTYGYSSLSMRMTKSSGVLTGSLIPNKDTGIVLVENRQNPNQTMHQNVLYSILYYSSGYNLPNALLNALTYEYNIGKYGKIGEGDLIDGYSYTLGYCTISGEQDSATVVIKEGVLKIQNKEPGYFYGSGTKPITAMMVINALSQKMPHLSGEDFVKAIVGKGEEIQQGQGALTLGKALTLGPDNYYEVLKDQPKSIKDWIKIYFSSEGCKYKGLTQYPCPSNICNTVSNGNCSRCTCPVPALNNDVLQNKLSIYDLTCMRGGIPDTDTNAMDPLKKGTSLIRSRFRPTPSELPALGITGWPDQSNNIPPADWPDDTLEQWAVRSHAIGPLEYLFETVGLDWVPGWTLSTPNTPNMIKTSIPPASYTSSGFTLLGSILWVLATEGGGDWMSIDLNKLYLPDGLQNSINFAGTSGNGGSTYIRRKGT